MVMQTKVANALTSTKTKYYSANYEKETTITGSTTNVREKNYIFAPDGLAAIYETNNGTSKMYYTTTDHLGSINMIVDEMGVIQADMSYDAWGRRRNAQDWTYSLNNFSTTAITDRGYTGHEHMDAFNLINMNGRAYDAKLGQFLSPDPFVQAPENTQSYNRYSYCLNNPLKYTDPSGYYSTSNNADQSFSGNWNSELDYIYHRGNYALEGGFEGTTAFFTNGGGGSYGIGSYAGGKLGDDFVASSSYQAELNSKGITRNGGQWGTWGSIQVPDGSKYGDGTVTENVFTPFGGGSVTEFKRSNENAAYRLMWGMSTTDKNTFVEATAILTHKRVLVPNISGYINGKFYRNTYNGAEYYEQWFKINTHLGNDGNYYTNDNNEIIYLVLHTHPVGYNNKYKMSDGWDPRCIEDPGNPMMLALSVLGLYGYAEDMSPFASKKEVLNNFSIYNFLMNYKK